MAVTTPETPNPTPDDEFLRLIGDVAIDTEAVMQDEREAIIAAQRERYMNSRHTRRGLSDTVGASWSAAFGL